MIRHLPILVSLALAACSAPQTQAQTQQVLMIAINALPCYQAVKASLPVSGDTTTKVLTGADVAFSSPSCMALDSATQTLIASALNTKTPVVAATQ